ncbi:MAG: tRNA (adenosine(37)-N6)-threonylcarbamoyltransferase complex transferase subunit TsaD [Candidatus Omnitrophica bacterium]|nr:tRNA (adenosine(37)-N6)-threonylcarbamoyltransferase complex transferase subunit TsaD [Candidatus Omnitrophota bacterium]
MATYTLGIETSCDETAAAVVRDGKKILSSVVSSSLRYHSRYGGVVPEIAFRKQLETIVQVSDCALKDARLPLQKISALCVTEEPGLLGSLFVGVSFARALALALSRPLVGVNHLYAHIYAGLFGLRDVRFPFMALVVSGGHTSLFYVRDYNRLDLIGETLDDACGEAFDKVAKILGLGYPGGPLIERIAAGGNPKAIEFNCCDTRRPFDFSFSGIKTAVLYRVRALRAGVPLTLKRDIAASFQEAVVRSVAAKSLSACAARKAKLLIVGGGVAANSRLRDFLAQKAEEEGVRAVFAPKELCMDNAAMVAGLGYQLFKKGVIFQP